MYADVDRESLTNDADFVVTKEFQKIVELAAEGELIKAIFDMHVFLLTLPK